MTRVKIDIKRREWHGEEFQLTLRDMEGNYLSGSADPHDFGFPPEPLSGIFEVRKSVRKPSRGFTAVKNETGGSIALWPLRAGLRRAGGAWGSWSPLYRHALVMPDMDAEKAGVKLEPGEGPEYYEFRRTTL